MGLLTPTHANYLTDKITAMYLSTLGTSASGLGLGDGTFGASAKATDITNLVQGSTQSVFADIDLEIQLCPAAKKMGTTATMNTLWQSIASGFIRTLNSVATRSRTVDPSISGFDAFLLYYNYRTATLWQCLCPPDWGDAYGVALGSSVASWQNLYYEIKQGSSYKGTTFTNGAGKFIVGTGYTAGSAVPLTYAGGYAWAEWTGLTGTGTITVTGTNHDQIVETWTGNITGANSTIQLTPVNSVYSLLRTVTNITTTGVSAGTIYIEAHAPSGRANPPS